MVREYQIIKYNNYIKKLTDLINYLYNKLLADEPNKNNEVLKDIKKANELIDFFYSKKIELCDYKKYS